ncbi:hypothetical protein [Jiulongibacter sediminis]|uniref:hypothetical protein n=1 Tax=Jiulongibacter sediminis TaxID=1605367 RepID=UPI000A77FB3B|nr:hypothetical protein [Jiulongibacter sediminis]
MKKILAVLVMMVVGVTTATAQRYYDDRHFYDEEFDWHWDVRVSISEGEQNGLLTNWEANRLYRKLERIEEKEYDYMADGNYDRWEQNDIWDDVVWLNRRVGIELADWDRRFYGFGNVYVGFNSYPFWYNRWYVNGWDFYRYDRLGWGSWRYGYVPRYYVPTVNVFVHTNRLRNYYHNHQVTYHHTNEPIRDRNTRGNTVVRRDRTDPANRVTNNSARRSSTYNSPNTRRSYESARNGSASTSSRSAREYNRPSTRSSAPNTTRSYGNSNNRTSSPSMRSSGNSSRSSSTMRTAPSRSSSPKSSSMRSSSPSKSSSARSSSMRSSSPSRSRSSAVSPSRSSSRSSASMRSSSGSSRSSSASRSSGGSRSSRSSRN